MLNTLLGLWYSLRDVFLAGCDLILRRHRRRYSHVQVIKAPAEAVWQLLADHDVRFEDAGIHISDEPVDGLEDTYIGRTTVGGRQYPGIAYRTLQQQAPHYIENRFLPKLSESCDHIGEDDLMGHRLEALDGGYTRLSSFRELTHTRASTRLLAPLGLRTNAWLVKRKAEKTANGPQSIRTHLLNQMLVMIATFASFWLLLDAFDALLLIVVILLHEASHGLAMMMVGVGIRSLTLVPFFGGMAIPKRAYSSEWQHGFVAWAGPGFSLLPTLALLWYAHAAQNYHAAHAAVIFTLVNGINLLPLPPLDGGVILNTLLTSLHRNLAWLALLTGTLTLLATALYLKSPLIGVVFLFALLQLLYQMSLKTDRHRRKLRWFQWPTVAAALVLTLSAYVAAAVNGVALEGRLEQRPPLQAATGIPLPHTNPH